MLANHLINGKTQKAEALKKQGNSFSLFLKRALLRTARMMLTLPQYLLLFSTLIVYDLKISTDIFSPLILLHSSLICICYKA